MVIQNFFVQCLLCYCCSAAVTVIPLTQNLPTRYQNDAKAASSDIDLLHKINPNMSSRPIVLTQSIFSMSTDRKGINAASNIYEGQDSVVRGAIDAGANNQHLVLRPDDVWFTILTQLSYYVVKNRKNLEGKWEDLPGKIPPRILGWGFLNFGSDFWPIYLFQKRDKTNWLLDWVKPNFKSLPNRTMGTQQAGNDMMATAIFMAKSVPSFEPMAPFPCRNGIPSITLLGSQSDWMALASKLTQMETGALGIEPRLYAGNLRPILSRFIATFDRPNDPAIRLFWNDIVTLTVRQPLCQQTNVVTGWINGLHFWDGAGNVLLTSQLLEAQGINSTAHLDTVIYPARRTQDLPTAYSELDGCEFWDGPSSVWNKLVVGMLARNITSGTPEGYKKAVEQAGFSLPLAVANSDHSMLQPQPIWIFHQADIPDEEVS